MPWAERAGCGRPSGTAEPVAGALQADSAALSLRIRDQRDTVEYILSQGSKRKISARESVRLMMGRADGVQIWVNQDSLGVAGRSDEVVVSLVLNQKGIVEKRLKKPEPKKPMVGDSSQVNLSLPQSVQKDSIPAGDY